MVPVGLAGTIPYVAMQGAGQLFFPLSVIIFFELVMQFIDILRAGRYIARGSGMFPPSCWWTAEQLGYAKENKYYTPFLICFQVLSK